MKMHFINIVPFFPDRLDYMALEAKRLLDCAGKRITPLRTEAHL